MISNVRFQVLNKKQIEKIMDATYRIMEEIGMDIHLDRAVELLRNEGCEVDGMRVKIPRELTKKALSLAPNGIQMYDK
jgi:trimethylamine--corrinoid protein Co-methyltransferase